MAGRPWRCSCLRPSGEGRSPSSEKFPLGFQDFLIGRATRDTWVMNGLLGDTPQGVRPGALTGGHHWRRKRPTVCPRRAAPSGGAAGEEWGPGGICRSIPWCPGPGSRERDQTLESLGSQHPVDITDWAKWPVQRAALKQESSGDETEKGASCLEIRTEIPVPPPPGRLSPCPLWPHSASRGFFHQDDPTHDPLASRVGREGGHGSLFLLPLKALGCSLVPVRPRALWASPSEAPRGSCCVRV